MWSLITVLLVGMILGWTAGVITGHSIRVQEQWDDTIRLLQDHIRYHSRSMEEDEQEWWGNKWRRN